MFRNGEYSTPARNISYPREEGAQLLISNPLQICDAKAAFLSDNQSNDSYPSTLSSDLETIQHFAISSSQDCYYLRSSDGRDFAIVHCRTASALQALRDLSSIRLEAVITGRDLNQSDQRHKKRKDTVFNVSIYIYGSDEVAHEVGKRLSKARIYLQHPVNLKIGVSYNNPHYYDIPGGPKEKSLYTSPSFGKEDPQPPVLDIAKLFVEVDRSRRLPSRDAHWCIRTPLLEYECPQGI